MHCWQLLTPDLVLSESVCGITPAVMEKYGLQGLIVDVDDTIVCSSAQEIAPEIRAWVASLQTQYPIWLVSNNFNEQRIQAIGKELGLPSRCRAAKPSLGVIREVLQAMQLPPEKVGMVGDRLFTDIVAGKRAGMFSILIQPVTSPRPQNWLALIKLQTKWIRQWEIWLARKSGVKI